MGVNGRRKRAGDVIRVRTRLDLEVFVRHDEEEIMGFGGRVRVIE